MSNTTYVGIDYGLGRTNRNKETGIRYGVIAQNSVGQAWYDSAEPDYGKPQETTECPECGENLPRAENWGDTVTCEHCGESSEVEIPDFCEPLGWNYENKEYKLEDCLGFDICVVRSPFYTYAQFCSPCVPGGCNLDSPLELEGEERPENNKAYCLGHDWFEDGKAPYRVFRVSDNTEVFPE